MIATTSAHVDRPAWRDAALAAAVAVIAHLGALWHEFTWDDGYNVVGNAEIRSLANVPSFFLKAWGTSAGDAMNQSMNTAYWRPLVSSSYAIDYALFGLSPTAFHAINLALHALVSVLVVVVGRRLFQTTDRDRVGVLLAACLFAVHPVHTEAVHVVTYRTDLFAAFWSLFLVAVWLGPTTRRSAGRERLLIGVVAPLLYAAGLASKEMAAPAILLVALVDLARLPRFDVAGLRRTALRLLPLAIVLVGYFAIRHALLTPSPITWFADLPPSRIAATMVGVFARYWKLMVLPWPLNPFYDWSVMPPAASWLEPWTVAGLVALAVFALAVVRAARTDTHVAVGLAWFLVCLLPVSQVLPIIVAASERFLYLASVGPLLVAGVLAARLSPARVSPAIGGTLVGAILVTFSALTVLRSTDWHTNRAILEANVRDWPTSFNAAYGLATLNEDERCWATASALWRRVGRDDAADAAAERARTEPIGRGCPPD